ncbi:MAG: hypothetical protein V4710_04675 [Verrucomicrobiota bacterium]
MGFFYSVRGWLELDNDHFQQVCRIVNADEDGIGHYASSWHFPAEGGGFSRFVFFGCTIRDSAVPSFRSQLERITSTVVSHDGDLTDYVEGVFHVKPEDESAEFVWHLSSGCLVETNNLRSA